MSFWPTGELVAIHWLKALSATLNPTLIGTILPGPDDETNNLSWGASAFAQVASVGGTPEIDLPLRHSVISVDTWAANVGKKRAPWGRSNNLAELIVNAVWDLDENAVLYKRPVITPAAYRNALVHNAQATEPQRRPSDEANWAHYGFELTLDWVALPA
jgi:hypothetical protein